jgi:hypothetical protein
MAYIKILRNRNVVALEEYLFKGRDGADPIELNGCSEGLVSEQFIGTQMHHGEKEFFGAIHVIQSFKDSDSSKLAPEEYPILARRMVEELFPGHEFCVVTHTDEDHIHNHIMLNPVNSETGKRIHDKKHVLYDLRAKSDEICVELGLSIIEAQSKETWKKTPEHVRAQRRHGGFSWVLDLKEKADFAKSIATSFDEYSGVLNQFGIQVRVENKNISYGYPGRKAKRDDAYGLGTKFSKSALKETFRENYQKFFDVGLKKKPIEEINFSDHWVIHRKSKESFVPEYRYSDLVIPKDLIRSIQGIEIEAYAKELGHSFSDEKGKEKSVNGKDYLKISENRWFNEKSKARGGAFEYINFCHNESWLETLKRFDTTGKVKKVQELLDDKVPSFKAFYSPKPFRAEKNVQNPSLGKFAFESSKILSALSKEGRVKVTRSGKLRLVPQENPNSSLTFHRQRTGWVTRRTNGLRQAFVSMQKIANRPLLIFEDPISFLSSGKLLDRISSEKSRLNIVVPLQPLDEFLKENEKEFKKYPKVRIVRAKESLWWGPDGKERKIEEEQISEWEKAIGIKFGSIEELLKELILGRTR